MPREPAKTERNLAIYRDFLSGKLSQVDFVKKYGITMARVYFIVARLKRQGQLLPDEEVERRMEIPDFEKLDSETGEE